MECECGNRGTLKLVMVNLQSRLPFMESRVSFIEDSEWIIGGIIENTVISLFPKRPNTKTDLHWVIGYFLK